MDSECTRTVLLETSVVHSGSSVLGRLFNAVVLSSFACQLLVPFLLHGVASVLIVHREL